MSEEHTGWGAPPAEVEQTAAPVEEQEAPQQEEQPEGGELILGKFKTQEDLVEAYRRAEAERGRLANELGQARRATEEKPPVLQQRNTDPEEVMETILRTPPSQLARDTGPWDEFVTQALGWDTSTMDSADWVEAKSILRNYQEQRQQRYVEQQREVEKAVETFFSHNEDLADWRPLVAQVENDFIAGGKTWSSFEEYERDIAGAARERIGKLAATWMGRQGGKAAAQSKVVPGGGVTGAGGQVGGGAKQYIGWGDPDAA